MLWYLALLNYNYVIVKKKIKGPKSTQYDLFEKWPPTAYHTKHRPRIKS